MLRNLSAILLNALRDYQTGAWEGGDPACPHEIQKQGKTGQRADRAFTKPEIFKDVCALCGARRIDAQIGLEKTPQEFIAKLVKVFREVHRCLKKDGTIWVNMGAGFANGGNGGGGKQRTNRGSRIGPCPLPPGFKTKDLIPTHWMLAMALQADGWWLRSDIIWSKPNVMPESITDRPTKSHEYIFLLSKSAKYLYRGEAICEPATPAVKITRSKSASYAQAIANGRVPSGNGKIGAVMRTGNTRNKRDVWTIPTHSYKGAHFATFPPRLPTICIKAGSNHGDLVLDPFHGSGTTGIVARRLGRRYVGIDLSAAYIDLSIKRFDQQKPSIFGGLLE